MKRKLIKLIIFYRMKSGKPNYTREEVFQIYEEVEREVEATKSENLHDLAAKYQINLPVSPRNINI